MSSSEECEQKRKILFRSSSEEKRMMCPKEEGGTLRDLHICYMPTEKKFHDGAWWGGSIQVEQEIQQ